MSEHRMTLGPIAGVGLDDQSIVLLPFHSLVCSFKFAPARVVLLLDPSGGGEWWWSSGGGGAASPCVLAPGRLMSGRWTWKRAGVSGKWVVKGERAARWWGRTRGLGARGAVWSSPLVGFGGRGGAWIGWIRRW